MQQTDPKLAQNSMNFCRENYRVEAQELRKPIGGKSPIEEVLF
jgi:hypothetical protein